MAVNADHLRIDELDVRIRGAKNVVERSHCQLVWLLAKGLSTREVGRS